MSRAPGRSQTNETKKCLKTHEVQSAFILERHSEIHSTIYTGEFLLELGRVVQDSFSRYEQEGSTSADLELCTRSSLPGGVVRSWVSTAPIASSRREERFVV